MLNKNALLNKNILGFNTKFFVISEGTTHRSVIFLVEGTSDRFTVFSCIETLRHHEDVPFNEDKDLFLVLSTDSFGTYSHSHKTQTVDENIDVFITKEIFSQVSAKNRKPKAVKNHSDSATLLNFSMKK